MIDFTDDQHLSTAKTLGRVGGGDVLRMPVTDSHISEEWVFLARPDFFCSECDDQIGLNEFGEGAPLLNLLANQKARHGRTICTACDMGGGDG